MLRDYSFYDKEGKVLGRDTEKAIADHLENMTRKQWNPDTKSAQAILINKKVAHVKVNGEMFPVMDERFKALSAVYEVCRNVLGYVPKIQLSFKIYNSREFGPAEVEKEGIYY